MFNCWRFGQYLEPLLWCELDFAPLPSDLLANAFTQLFQAIDGICLMAREVYRSAGPAGGHEYRAQGVVIALRNGFQFVVVATGTGDGGCQECFRERIDFVVHHLLMHAVEV